MWKWAKVTCPSMKTPLCPSWICLNMLMMGWNGVDIRTWTDINMPCQGKRICFPLHFLFSQVSEQNTFHPMWGTRQIADCAPGNHIYQNRSLDLRVSHLLEPSKSSMQVCSTVLAYKLLPRSTVANWGWADAKTISCNHFLNPICPSSLKGQLRWQLPALKPHRFVINTSYPLSTHTHTHTLPCTCNLFLRKLKTDV